MHLETKKAKLAVTLPSLEKMDEASVHKSKLQREEANHGRDRMPNFRNVLGFANLYRASCPDDIAEVLIPTLKQQEKSMDGNSDLELSSSSPDYDAIPHALTESERFLLYDATLWIDLRFSKEIDELKISTLIKHAPGGAFECVAFDDSQGLEQALGNQRAYLGNPVLSSKATDDQRHRFYLHNPHNDPFFSEDSFVKYVCANWVASGDLENAVERNTKMQLIGNAVHRKGLFGLNEAILEHHRLMSIALKAITIHLEQWQEEKEGRPGKVLINCSLGKDRTGNLSVLCQHMIGASEEEILHDYFLSNCIYDVALEQVRKYLDGKVDLSCYANCDKESMRTTLAYLRRKYGSMDGYLDVIGFDESWRQRFVKVAK
jgi:hypothetical protein